MQEHKMVSKAKTAVESVEVQDMIRRLAAYDLGVFMPHLHNEEGFAPLPSDIVQLEGDLRVSFVNQNDSILSEAAPVGWIWNEEKSRVCAACYCTGAEHLPHWDRKK